MKWPRECTKCWEWMASFLAKVGVHMAKSQCYKAAEHLTWQCQSFLIFKHIDDISEASGNCTVINSESKWFLKKCVVKSTMWSVVMAVTVRWANATAQSDVNVEQLLGKRVKSETELCVSQLDGYFLYSLLYLLGLSFLFFKKSTIFYTA